MKIRINELRKIIRRVIVEGEEERVYDDTVLPGEEADSELIAEPDLTDQEDRDDYLGDKQRRMSRKKRDRLQSREESGSTDESNAIAGGGVVGHVGSSWKAPRKSRPLKSKNAMGRSKRPLDEYDE